MVYRIFVEKKPGLDLGFEEVAKTYSDMPEGFIRCFNCYKLRLEKSIKYAIIKLVHKCIEVFGMFTKMQVRDKMVPVVCVLAPALSWIVQWQLKEQFNYTTSFELLIINAVLTVAGLALLSVGKNSK